MKDFPTSEKIGKMKAEREKFYDALLQKILALPTVQEYIGELRKDEEWNKRYRWGEFEFEENALEDFLESEPKDILQVVEIWNMVQEDIREKAQWITADTETFLRDGLDFNAEDTMTDKLEEINDELDHALKRRHKKT